MSQRGTSTDSSEVEDKALEQERDDAPVERQAGEESDDALDGDEVEVDPDAGEETGETGDDAGGDGDGERAPEVRAPSRAQRRVEAATRIAAQAKAEAEAARREAAELRARIQGQQTEAEAALERERVALMTPEERAEHRLKKLEETNAQFMRGQQLQLADINDRSGFAALCARQTTEGKLYASVADEVEEQLAEARRAGINPQRQVIAERILGQRMLKRALGTKSRQQKTGAERLRVETVRKPGGGSDVRSGAGRTTESEQRRKRLESMEI